MSEIIRYSDEDLEMFKKVVEQKLEKANSDLIFLSDQIQNITEAMGEDSDWIDETSTNSELEMLHTMSNRQHSYIQDLKNALLRIQNKTYGVCVVTGGKIDKQRLLAVPTTTKSIEAKTAAATPKKKERKPVQTFTKKEVRPKVIVPKPK